MVYRRGRLSRPFKRQKARHCRRALSRDVPRRLGTARPANRSVKTQTVKGAAIVMVTIEFAVAYTIAVTGDEETGEERTKAGAF